MTYIKANVGKPGPNAGTGIKPKGAITFIDVEDILNFPHRDDKGVLVVGSIVPKQNAYGITIYATRETIELASNSEGEADNEGFKPHVKFKHPGNSQEIREFKHNWLGKDCVVIVDYCDGRPKEIIGTICNGARMQVNYTGNKEANGNEFTFQQATKGLDIGMYQGTIPYAQPTGVITAGATSIALTGDGQYQLSGHSASVTITAATGAVDGMIFTLLGATSATAPSIAASAVFILKNGETWNASNGSQITFKAVKSAPAAFVFVEQARV